MVYPATVSLSAPGLDDLVLDPANGWAVQSLDVGDPTTRTVMQSAPSRDGVIDTTRFVGERSISLHVVVVPGMYAELASMEDHLKAFTNPRLRPVMTVQRPGQNARQIVLSRGAVMAPIAHHEFTEAIVSWVAPSGVFESADLRTFEVAASATTELGRSYDLTFDRSYPPSPPVAEVVVTNAGNIDAPPLIQLHGPWSGETRVVNVTAGRELVFDNESVTAGNYIEIDVARRTVTLNGDPSNGRYDRLVSPGWWELVPGPNVLRFLPETSTAPARMIGAFRDRFL